MSKPAPGLFIIGRAQGRWTVTAGVQSHGPYLSRMDAFLDAVDAAHLAAGGGGSAQVVDRTGGQGDKIVWRSDSDSYPPSAGEDTCGKGRIRS